MGGCRAVCEAPSCCRSRRRSSRCLTGCTMQPQPWHIHRSGTVDELGHYPPMRWTGRLFRTSQVPDNCQYPSLGRVEQLPGPPTSPEQWRRHGFGCSCLCTLNLVLESLRQISVCVHSWPMLCKPVFLTALSPSRHARTTFLHVYGPIHLSGAGVALDA